MMDLEIQCFMRPIYSPALTLCCHASIHVVKQLLNFLDCECLGSTQLDISFVTAHKGIQIYFDAGCIWFVHAFHVLYCKEVKSRIKSEGGQHVQNIAEGELCWINPNAVGGVQSREPFHVFLQPFSAGVIILIYSVPVCSPERLLAHTCH